MKRYLVGGAVRDALLGLPVGDRDWVVVGADADELRRRRLSRRSGADFPVFLHPETHEEHALARTERKTGARLSRLRVPRRAARSRSKRTCCAAT